MLLTPGSLFFIRFAYRGFCFCLLFLFGFLDSAQPALVVCICVFVWSEGVMKGNSKKAVVEEEQDKDDKKMPLQLCQPFVFF